MFHMKRKNIDLVWLEVEAFRCNNGRESIDGRAEMKQAALIKNIRQEYLLRDPIAVPFLNPTGKGKSRSLQEVSS